MSIDLYNGDCLEILKELPDKSVDLFVCDLPYGCLHAERKSDTSKWYNKAQRQVDGCAWDIKINLEKLWEQIKRLAKDEHTPVLMFATTKFGNELINSNPSWFRYDLVWDKGRGVSFLSANRMPMRSHEMIYVFSKAGAYYNRVDISGGKPYNRKNTHLNLTSNQYGGIKKIDGIRTDSNRCVLSVIHNHNCNLGKKDTHPTEKPIELYKWLIERYSPANGLILDPTAGSFNSCIAAQQLGRNSIGIEKDKKFYDKAVEKTGAE